MSPVFADDSGYDFGGGSSYDFGGGSNYDFGGGSGYDFGGSSSYDFGGNSSYDFGGNYAYDFGGSDPYSFTDSYNPGYYTTDSYNPGYYATDSYDPGYYQTDSYNPGYYAADSYDPGYYSTDFYNPGYYSSDLYASSCYTCTQYSYPGYSTFFYHPSYHASLPFYSAYSPAYQQPFTFAAPSYASYPSAPTAVAQVTNVNTIQQQQHPVVYTYSQPQQQPSPSCSISLSSGYGGQYGGSYPATLSWSSANATAASISAVGAVSLSGSRTVYPTSGQVYTMTVSGPGGTNTCQTQSFYIPTPIVYSAPITYPVPTAVPTPVYYPAAVSCSITASPNAIRNGERSMLSWTSSGSVTSATLSDGIGAVSPNGSITVMPESSRSYTLTVYGQGMSASCNAYVTVAGGAPYVSLSQIPYTGFDFGPVGNAIYFLSLLSFALAGAYLAAYYIPAQRAFAGIRMPAVFAGRRRADRSARASVARATQSVIELPQSVGGRHAARAIDAIELPGARPMPEFRTTLSETAPFAGRTTSDTMTMLASQAGSAPRIVISRA